MKLYMYGHCPFCVRARTIFGLRGVGVENITLANDDEDTPIGTIGAKQVPTPEKNDGTFMGESLNIVYYIDETAGKGRLKTEARPELQAWPDKIGECNNHPVQSHLVRIGLFELVTESVVQYFIDKKEKNIGSFETNLNEIAQYLKRFNQDLAQLETLTASGSGGIGDEIGMEDILTLPILYSLTIVHGVQWPAKIADYLARMSAQSGVSLYFDRALQKPVSTSAKDRLGTFQTAFAYFFFILIKLLAITALRPSQIKP